MAKCKGSLIMLAVQSLRAAKLPKVPKNLERYMTERVEILSWYPESDLIDILKLLASLHPNGSEEGLLELGRQSARFHIKKTYRRQLDRKSEIALARLWNSQHDSGTFHDYHQGDAHIIELTGYQASCYEMCISTTGYMAEVMRYIGYENSFEKNECIHEGGALCRWSAT